MKAASLSDIKKELSKLEEKELLNVCLRLARYKKENKELLTYVIFESDDEESYGENLKSELSEQFENINRKTIYLTKKSLRKILRFLDRFLRYSGNKETEVNTRIHFCKLMNEHKIPVHRSKVLLNIYERQIDKVEKAIDTLHEDLQYDYKLLVENLES